MNSEVLEDDAVANKNYNEKEANKNEARSQLTPETVLKLEGTHTTSTDTDTLTLISERTEIPETSARLRKELMMTSLQNERIHEVDKAVAKQAQNELSNRSIGELIIEMNENLQAIIAMMCQNKHDEDTTQTYNEMFGLSKTQVYLNQIQDNLRPTLIEESLSNNFATESQELVVNTQPKPLANRSIIDSRQLVIVAEPNDYVNESLTKLHDRTPDFTCVLIKDTLASASSIVPLDYDAEMAASTTPMVPCENVFQTLHIRASNSPTASMMYRPPIGVRLWMVITDFFTTICVCLQANRDCIFCLGFFVAFVVSASVLTAFFYRTLSLDPQLYRNQKYQHQMEKAHDATYPHRPS